MVAAWAFTDHFERFDYHHEYAATDANTRASFAHHTWRVWLVFERSKNFLQ